jgi:MFS family permease
MQQNQGSIASSNASAPATLPMAQVLLCGALIVTLSMGIRHGFGLWMNPMTQAFGWTRADYSFAIAVQNMAWGVTGIFAGMLADKFGAFRIILFCGLCYSLGLLGMSQATTPTTFALATGLLIGTAQSGTTYSVIYGILGRNIPAAKRSWAMGITAAAGSFGQFLMLPVESQLIAGLGWQNALVALSALSLLILPVALFLREPGFAGGAPIQREQTIWQALTEAFRYPSFQLLMAGYFVCGFQVVFIGIHLPSYLKDKGLEPAVAANALALVGLFNVFGTYAAGALGERFKKTNILSFIYLARAVAIVAFLAAPLSPTSVYLFSSVMGLLWLSTVPPTSATVAQIFGVAHMSMLGGFVFVSHQVGSFLGVWLGSLLYDKTGSYDVVWQLCIALGVFAALINLPVKETPIVRAPRAVAA